MVPLAVVTRAMEPNGNAMRCSCTAVVGLADGEWCNWVPAHWGLWEESLSGIGMRLMLNWKMVGRQSLGEECVLLNATVLEVPRTKETGDRSPISCGKISAIHRAILIDIPMRFSSHDLGHSVGKR